MDLQETARAMMAAHQATKRAACRRAQGPSDLSQLLDVRLGTGESMIALIGDRDQIPMVTDALSAGRRVRYIALCADAYGKYHDPPLANEPERGSVTAAFESGDMSVIELLAVAAVDVVSGDVLMVETTYTYDDRGMPVFGPLEERSSELDGGVIDALRGAAEQHRGAWTR